MLGWLYRIFIGSFKICEHEWELVENSIISQNGTRIGFVRIYECSKCRKQKINKFKNMEE